MAFTLAAARTFTSVERIAQRSALRQRSSAPRAVARTSLKCAAVEGWEETKGGWLPGYTGNPAYLDGSLPGDFGFDPLGLGANPEDLAKFQQQEVIHGRFAMLGLVGMVVPEALGLGTWTDAPMWMVNGEFPSYLGNTLPTADTVGTTIAITLTVQLIAMGFAEGYRSNSENPTYPGGMFNPAGFGGKSDDDLMLMKIREIKHGRLAMLAVLGVYVSTAVTGLSPLESLAAHQADPFNANIGQYITVGPPEGAL